MANYSPRTGFGGDPLRTAQKGAKYLALYGEWNVSNNPGFFKGQFNNFQKEMVAINRARASEFQDLVVDKIRERTKRKSSSTGRLIEVTADKRNTSFTNAKGGFTPSALGWFVGITPFLDSSVAKYWRTIEEGSLAVWKKPFSGPQKTKGGDPLWGFWGAGAARAGSGAQAVGPFTPPDRALGGGKGQGKFAPFFKPKGYTEEAAAAKWQLIVGHEIQPMNAYRDAWVQIGPRATSDWTRAWNDSFGRVPTSKDKFLNAPARGRRKR